jgi:hypothetical protein
MLLDLLGLNLAYLVHRILFYTTLTIQYFTTLKNITVTELLDSVKRGSQWFVLSVKSFQPNLTGLCIKARKKKAMQLSTIQRPPE